MKYQVILPALAAVAMAKCSPSSSSQGSGTASKAAAQSLYGQCGGTGYSGPTACSDGAVCTQWNPYYHQCVAGQTTLASVVASTAAAEPSSPSSAPSVATAAKSSTTPVVVASSSSAAVSSLSSAAAVVSSVKPAQPSSASAVQVSSASPAASSSAPAAASSAASSGASSGSGTVYKASFTQYGSSDTWGSGTCNTKTAACGFYSNPGYNAAVSENFFGVGPGAGAGPGCGTCWALTPSADSSGNALNGAKSIVVKINNLCPAQGNPLCSQSGKTGTNQYGANVNFDLCIDDGANTALFGSSNVGLATGTATQVDCSEWSGTDIKKRMSI